MHVYIEDDFIIQIIVLTEGPVIKYMGGGWIKLGVGHQFFRH